MKSSLHLLLFCFVMSGCAGVSTDPYEGFNRRVHAFNSTLDRWALKPLARGYRAVLPDPVEGRVRNVFANLGEPFVAFNQILQGKPRLAAQDTGRFLLNSTFGLAGIFDVATPLGLTEHQEDFGQTLAVWGVNQGPYLVLPFWGPSNPRDGFGDLAGSYGFLPRYLDDVPTRNGVTALWVIQRRAAFLRAEDIELQDRYAFYRDAYLQRRAFLIADGEIDDPFLDDLGSGQ